MVRNKQPPQQLNDAQQRRNNWNLLDGGAGPADDGGGGREAAGGGEREADMDGRERGRPQLEEEDDLLDLIVRDEYEDDDDDDDDVEFIQRVRFADYDDVYVDEDVEVVEEARVVRRRRQQQQQGLEYGAFREVLDDAQFYVRVGMDSDSSAKKDRNTVCYFGSLSVTLQKNRHRGGSKRDPMFRILGICESGGG